MMSSSEPSRSSSPSTYVFGEAGLDFGPWALPFSLDFGSAVRSTHDGTEISTNKVGGSAVGGRVDEFEPTDEITLLRELLTPEIEAGGFGYRTGAMERRDWLYLLAAPSSTGS